MPLLSIFTDHDDICFWRMSLSDQRLQFPENTKDFFRFDLDGPPKTMAEWIEKLVLPEDRQMVGEKLNQAVTNNSYVARFLFRIRAPAGGFRWIEQRGAIEENQTDPQIIWLSQDVTEKLQTAASLQTTRDKLQDILDRAKVGMVTLNSQGQISYCNPAIYDMLGYQASELIGTSISHLVAPENIEDYERQLRRLLTHEIHSFRIECQLVTKSGVVIWVEKNIWLLPEQLGHDAEFFGVVISMQESRETMELLRQERDTLRAVFESADVGLGLTDSSGKTIAMNKAALRTHGVKDLKELEETLSAPNESFSLRYPDGREMGHEQWPAARAARGDYVSDYDVILTRKKTGISRYVKYASAPVYDTSGQKRLTVYSMNDLTEMRRLHEALSQSQRLEALGRLAGGVAHDFNNVLAVIAGNLELIADSASDDRTRSRSTAALDAAQAGISINQRLLRIARKRLPARREVDIVRRIRGMSELLVHSIGSSVSLEIDLPDEGLIANVDPGDMDAAFLNLVSNARDSMQSGGKLHISVKRANNQPQSDLLDTSNDREIILTVRDTGTGMSPETLRVAAEPFFTTKDAGKGTGLGLTGVYAFANDCGGRVEIDSNVDKGTEVRIYLPDAGKASESSKSADQPKLEQPTGTGEVILVVEDDTLVREMTCQRLLKLGYRVEEAESADEAMTRIQDGLRPACILSDIKMPGKLDGIQLADKLDDLLPNTVTILSTGYHDDKILEHKLRLKKPRTTLFKPYTLTELVDAIQAAIAK